MPGVRTSLFILAFVFLVSAAVYFFLSMDTRGDQQAAAMIAFIVATLCGLLTLIQPTAATLGRPVSGATLT